LKDTGHAALSTAVMQWRDWECKWNAWSSQGNAATVYRC
jgi:hypothetical protein